MAAGRLFLPGWMPALDNNGAPIPNAKAYFYLNETDTLASVYSDESLSVPLSNPVLANSSGRFPAIWASDAVTYSYSIDAPYGPAGVPFTGDGLSVSQGVAILVAEAAEAAADDAAASAAAALVSENSAEAAYEEILAFAAASPESPSIVNKLNRNADNADASVLTNLPYLQSGTGAVSRSQKSKNDDALNTRDFGVTADGTTDDTLALAASVVEHLSSGRPLKIQPGRIVTTAGINAIASVFVNNFAASINIRGSGMGRTIFDYRGSNDWFFETGSSTAFRFILGGYIGDFTITSTVPGVNASGIRLRSTYNLTCKNIEIIGLTANGFDDACLAGDSDGNVLLLKDNIRVSNCGGWGYAGAAATGFNENSGLDSRAVFVQNCGTNEATAITGITQANPAVVTSANHGRSNGDIVYIGGVQGMTQVNTSNSEVAYVVAGATTNTFQLTGINSTGFGAYTSGGHVVSARPRSGGVKWKGQISRHDRMFLTINKNVSFYVENGPATAQGLDLSGVVIENPQYCGGIIAGCSEVLSSMGQSYANAAQAGAPCYLGWVFDGTTDVVQGVRFDKHTVRVTADNPDYSQWNMVGTNVSPQTIRVKDTFWKEFGYTRQRRFTSQFRFDAVVSPNITCVAVDAATAIVRASEAMGMGAFVPIRLQYTSAGSVSTGEWASRYITSVSITKPGSDGTYQIYLYDNANVVTAEASATAPVKDSVSGYMVKTGDPTRLWVGQLAVSGGNWVTTTGGWLNPLMLGGPQPGVPVWGFFNDADRSWNIKNSANKPSSAGDFTFKYLPAFAAQKVFDLPSIAAGASTTFTMVSGDGALGQVGDWVDAVSASIATGGLVLSGEFTATNTITVTAQNPTAGAIDMASATFYAKFTRR